MAALQQGGHEHPFLSMYVARPRTSTAYLQIMLMRFLGKAEANADRLSPKHRFSSAFDFSMF